MQKIVEIGKLKHPIEIQQVIVDVDECGFQVEKNKTILKTRCMIEFDKSYKLNKEVWTAEGVDTFTTKIFTFRKHPSIEITQKQKLIYKGQEYQIYIVNDIDEEGRFVKVWANRIVRD